MFNTVEFLSSAIMQGTPLLLGSTGEIITEKSGYKAFKRGLSWIWKRELWN